MSWLSLRMVTCTGKRAVLLGVGGSKRCKCQLLTLVGATMVTASWGTGAPTKVSLQPSSRTHCLAAKLSRWPSHPCGCRMLTLLTIVLTMLTTFCSRWHVEAITPSVSPQTGTSSPGVRTTVARLEVGPRLTRGITISHTWSHSSQGASCYKLSHPS